MSEGEARGVPSPYLLMPNLNRRDALPRIRQIERTGWTLLDVWIDPVTPH